MEKQTPTQWYRKNHHLFDNSKSMINACHLDTGSSLDICKRLYNRLISRGEIMGSLHEKHPHICSNQQKIGMSEEELRNRYDVRVIVQQAIDKLQQGIYLEEPEFIRMHLRGLTNFRHIIDHPDMVKYKGRVGGKTYWSHPSSILKMKEEGILN